MRSENTTDISLCQYNHVSCVRCCLPHIGGDSHMGDTEEEYLGPGGIVIRFNPQKDPRIVASQYEDVFQDVGKEEMERRFSERRALFLKLYDREKPEQSLSQYMRAAQRNEGYRYKPAAEAGPASMHLGGSVPKRNFGKGELPECQLLGFVDGNGRAGCMAHPLAETSLGYDGRDRVGFFHHSGCCENIGCEASREFRYLSPSAMKVFDKAVAGMSWYEYSRHATSVLVFYLRSFDHLIQELDERERLDALTLSQLVAYTNALGNP